MMNVALYMRLSKEDEFCHEESNSIAIQRIMLADYVREHFPDARVLEFADDGYSGTNFERPGVQELLDRVKNGEIGCIIVKDFSRFARDYIELGSYLEQIFPFMGVRFISVNDKYDSDEYAGNVADIDVNFKNLLYDLYSKDLSVKIKSSLRSIKEQGNFVGTEPPFGYMKDPEDRHRLIIAEDEADVVRRLFEMYDSGMSSVEMAKELNREGAKTPAQIRVEKGMRTFKPKGGVYVWQHTSILRMLKNRDYIGDLVQGIVECRKMRGDKKLTEPENWIITENHHEPIIDRELFDRVQERFKKPKSKWKRTDGHMLVGRLVCGGCGRTLRHSVSGKHYYWCSGLNINHVDGCVKRVEDYFLEEVILYRLQQRIMELGEADRLLQEEKDRAADAVETMKAECRAAENAIEAEKKKRMAEFEAYALGEKESYNASTEQIERLRRAYEDAREKLSEAEDNARKLGRIKSRGGFPVMKLTAELMDEYIESVSVHSDEDIRIIWK